MFVHNFHRTLFIIAHKRSLRRLCFYTCLSFCSWRGARGGGHAWQGCAWQGDMCGRGACVAHTPWTDTPLGRHPYWADTPPGRHPQAENTIPSGQKPPTPWADTLQANPPGRHSAGQTPQGRQPPAHCMLSYTLLPSACWHTPPCTVHAGIQSTSGQYASHWNALLLLLEFHSHVTHYIAGLPLALVHSSTNMSK